MTIVRSRPSKILRIILVVEYIAGGDKDSSMREIDITKTGFPATSEIILWSVSLVGEMYWGFAVSHTGLIRKR